MVADVTIETTSVAEEKELLKIGVIGMGNCGGQMVDLASENGFDAVAINASEKDLRLLKSDNVIEIPVGDGRGTGKNRDEAADFFLNRINMVQDPVFVGFVDSHDVIVIASSIGGGFGCGSSLILTDVLMKMTGGNKVIIPAGVFPFEDESYTAQNHAIEWLKELSKLEVSYILYDNAIFQDKPKQEACNLINKQFVHDLQVLRGDMLHETRTGGIDNRDMLTAIGVPGRLVIDTIPLLEAADVVDGSIIATLVKHIKDTSAHAEMADDKIIKASALMYALRDEFSTAKPGLKSELQETFGSHINDYDNFTDLEDESDVPDTVSLILAGLSEPNLRINRLVSRRDKLEQELLNKKQVTSKLSGASDGNEKLRIKAKSFASTEAPVKSTADFLSDYVASRKK